MTIEIGRTDKFERRYVQRFRYLIENFGEFIRYEYDRAAVDLGLHLTEPSTKVVTAETVSSVKVWFQLKGIQATTFSQTCFNNCTDIKISPPVEQIKFWYASPEAIYIAIYVECVDVFIAEDIRDIVDRRWQENILNPLVLGDRKTATVRLDKNAILNEERLRSMIRHRSLRIDGPSFRGRPLGHRLDPLRCTLEEIEPSIFSALVNRLLTEHGYEIEEKIDAKNIFSDNSEDIAELLYGTLHFTYEWVPQLTTQFGFSFINGKFRIEGEPFFAQGKCAVLIHSAKLDYPQPKSLQNLIKVIKTKNIEHFLVFVNTDLMNDPLYEGIFVSAQRETGISFGCIPQGLGEITFSLLISTLVYLDFRDKVSFKLTNYLWS